MFYPEKLELIFNVFWLQETLKRTKIDYSNVKNAPFVPLDLRNMTTLAGINVLQVT